MRYLAFAALILPLLACTASQDIALLHREITDVQREVQQLGQSSLGKGDLAAMEQGMREATQQTLRSNADLMVRVEELQEQIEALRASLDLTTRNLQSISQELATLGARMQSRPILPPPQIPATGSGEPAGTAVGDPGSSPAQPQLPATDTGPTGPVNPVSSPEQLYQSAYEDYMRGNYDLAAQGFSDYLQRWSNTDLADNAQYWIGECYDALDRSEEALAAFSEVLEKHPTSDKAAAAQLKKGLLYLKLGDQGQGVVNLQYVVFEHPGTSEAELAREKLRSLGLTIR